MKPSEKRRLKQAVKTEKVKLDRRDRFLKRVRERNPNAFVGTQFEREHEEAKQQLAAAERRIGR